MWYLKFTSGHEDYDRDESQHSVLLGIDDYSKKDEAEKLAIERFFDLRKSENNRDFRHPKLVWKEFF